MKTGLNRTDNDICILDSFKNEDGFSSHVYALVLLLSITLVFSLATSQWVMQKSSSIQTVADSAALSASNTAGSYRQITQLVDAVIFTVGFTGVLCIAIGFVVACIPGISSFGVSLTDFGVRTIRARNSAAKNIYRVLEVLEKALPYLIGYSATRTVQSQANENFKYHGVALAFPPVSESEYPDTDGIYVSDDAVDMAQNLADKTRKEDRYRKEQDEALEEGWYADCGNPEHSLRERAQKLAQLSDVENPMYPTPEEWSFAAPILRSRNYYHKRIELEAPESLTPDDIRASACRMHFYRYAHKALQGAYVVDDNEGYKSNFPMLPATLDEYKDSALYTDTNWIGDSRYLHAYTSCPVIEGSTHLVSLKDVDEHELEICPHCKLSIAEQSLVTRLTAISETGYEYWYKKVAQAADKYEEATREIKRIEEERKEDEQEISNRFEDLLKQLSLQRVKFVPPGSRGCIALVYREAGAESPRGLTGLFTERSTLPRGYAIAGSALAPDKDSSDYHMLDSFAASITQSKTSDTIAGVCLDVWGNMLVDYGKHIDSVDEHLDHVADSLGSSSSGIVHRFKRLLSDVIEQVGLEPVDMKTYKPTLVQALKIINAESSIDVEELDALIQAIPTSEYEFANITLSEFGIEVDDGMITLCELDLPFIDKPLSIQIPAGVLWPN